MSVETKWRETLLKRRRMMRMGWGLTVGLVISALSFMLLGA